MSLVGGHSGSTGHLGLNAQTLPIRLKSVWPHRALRLSQTKSLCPADLQGCVTACGPGGAGHEALGLSQVFPSDLMKNAARNSRCLSFISFSCYGLSWGCRRLFVRELKIPCGALGQPYIKLLTFQAGRWLDWRDLGTLVQDFRVRVQVGEERKLCLGPENHPDAWVIFWPCVVCVSLGRDAVCNSQGMACAMGECCSLGRAL